MFKFYLASFISCFLMLNSFAQKQNVYFLKNDGRYVNLKDSADYIRIVREPDSGTILYNVLEYYLNGSAKMIGKSSLINPIKLEGQNLSFYPNKNKKRVCMYEHGQLTGDVFDYYPNGKMYSVITFNQSSDQNYYASLVQNQIIKAVYDSTGLALAKDGNGHYPIFDYDHKTIVEEGNVKNGKRDSIWTGTSNKGKIHFTENYINGKLVQGKSTDDKGNSYNYTQKEVLPQFKGGISAFGHFLGSNIIYPPDAKGKGIQGRVILSFVVEKDGKLTDIKILQGVTSDINSEASRVINLSPKWNPGLQNGIPVRVSYTQPINFAL